MWDDISKFKKRKYTILRHLYDEPLVYKELISQTSIAEKDVISTLGALISQGLVKKKKITVEVEPKEEMKEIADVLDKKTVTKRTTQYALTEKGLMRLAYWEYRYQLYQKVAMPWDESYDSYYFEDITRRIKERIMTHD